MGFNPHRRRNAGATARRFSPAAALAGFNPHRRRNAGATRELYHLVRTEYVSILTDAETPVPHPNRDGYAGTKPMFQSSPTPKRRCHPNMLPKSGQQQNSFNPHRRRNAGATGRALEEGEG